MEENMKNKTKNPTLKKRKYNIDSYNDLTDDEIVRKNARILYTKTMTEYIKELKRLGPQYYSNKPQEYYGAFVEAFYDVKDLVELCDLKGVGHLVTNRNKKNPSASAYLDFITADELNYLILALQKVIVSTVKESRTNEQTAAFPVSEIVKKALAMRELFKDNHDGMYPNQIPGCEHSAQIIIKPSTKPQEKDRVLTSEPRVKEQEKTHYAQLINEDGIVDNQPTNENVMNDKQPIDETIVDGNKPIKENDIHDAQPINENGIVNQPTNENVMNDKQPVEKNPSRLQKIKEAPKKFVRYVKNKIFGDDGRDM